MERKALSTSITLKCLALSALLMSAVGCTSLFFHPTHVRYPFLELDRLSAENVELKSKDSTSLSAWILHSSEARQTHPEIVCVADLKPSETRGVALQFHGNAENMTSHYRFQLWLLFEGWDVLTFDPRGYGMSHGDTSDLTGLRDDGVAALEWANQYAKERHLPLVVFGQSLGASLAISALDHVTPDQLKLLVIDSAFYSFRSIAREKLSSVWFFWPLQWLGWLLVSDKLSASKPLLHAKHPAEGSFATPAIFLHSENDPVVSNAQGERLYELYPGEKVRWTTKEPGHVNTLFSDLSDDDPPKSKTRELLKARLRTIQGSYLKGSTSRPSK